MPIDDLAPDLITLARAKLAVNLPTWPAGDEALLAVAVSAAGNAARRWCRSPLLLEAVEEIHRTGGGDLAEGLRVGAAPARLVLRVATDPGVGLTLTSASGGWVRVGASTLEFQVGAGPVRSITLASHATLSGLAAAAVALEPTLGISVVEATANPADLARTGARLPLGATGLPLAVYRSPVFDWRFWPGPAELRFTGPVTLREAVRLVVLAGHMPLPPAVEEAVAQWSATLFWRMRGQATGLPGDASHPPEGSRLLLAPYRVYRVGESSLVSGRYPA